VDARNKCGHDEGKWSLSFVIPGLVQGIHVFLPSFGPKSSGHDDNYRRRERAAAGGEDKPSRQPGKTTYI
jgi:hypothetical protein